MAENLYAKNIVKHIANGRLSELCLVCLSQLKEDSFESIFTFICKEETEYCVAEALEAVCQIELQVEENHNICTKCFKSASEAYKFHLKAKQSMEIITRYTDKLLYNIQNVDTTKLNDNVEILCIPISEYVPEKCLFDFNLDGIGNNTEIIERLEDDDEDEDETTNPMTSDESDDEMMVIVNKNKVKNKRNSMEYLACNKCSVKYRYVENFKKHMKISHDIEMYICKKCKILIENKEEYENHIKSHKNFKCAICDIAYKRESCFVAHMQKHAMRILQQKDLGKKCEQCGAIFEDEARLQSHVSLEHATLYTSYTRDAFEKHIKRNYQASKNKAGTEVEPENVNPEGADNGDKRVCNICGEILEGKARLKSHMYRKHVEQTTCFYCGKLYKSRQALEKHLNRHEQVWKKKTGTKAEDIANRDKRVICPQCGKDFVNERALRWHQRLHNNDRPFICDVCGRGFVSKNRRNRHAVCSHTLPSKRCPLCPALFHLRSLVNKHIKMVHLKVHKRSNRTVKRQKVLWDTETVPIQELSVELQNDILELQAKDHKEQLQSSIAELELIDNTMENESENSNLENEL